MKPFIYTQEHLDFIRKRKHWPRTALAAAFNKKFDSNQTPKQLTSLCERFGWLTGRTGCFEKGYRPWNAGTKGLSEPNKGNFKKGYTPFNLKPIGSERICPKDGYTLIKIAEPNIWRGKHIVLWETDYGKVPHDSVLRFKDGNCLNCTLENLEVISKQVNLYLNQNNHADLPAELKPSMVAVAKVATKVASLERKAL